MKTLLLIALMLLTVCSTAQKLGFGIGYTSSGDVPVTLQLDIKQFGGYLTYIAEAHPITPDYTGIWHNETMLGLSYQVFTDYPEIAVLAGAGWNSTVEFKREDTFPNAIYSEEVKGSSFEVGFSARVLKQCKWLYITASMGNYAGLKAMAVCKINLTTQ